LRATLGAQARRVRALIKIGRTHLQDATPLTLGQEFSGYVDQLEQAQARCAWCCRALPLAIGGTASARASTPIPEFARRVCEA
jgi:fumarate hydratase class II